MQSGKSIRANAEINSKQSIYTSEVGTNAEVTSAGDIIVTNGVSGNAELKAGGEIKAGSLSTNAKLNAKSNITITGNVGGNVVMRSSRGRIVVQNVGTNGEVHGYNGVTVIGTVGGNSKIESTNGDVLLNSDVSTNAKIRAQGNITISGNVGGNVEITSQKNVIIEGDIGSNVEITCSGQPVLKGKIGFNLTVNGADYADNHDQYDDHDNDNESKGGLSISSVNGVVTITQGNQKREYKGSSASFINGNLVIDGRLIENKQDDVKENVRVGQQDQNDSDIERALRESLKESQKKPQHPKDQDIEMEAAIQESLAFQESLKFATQKLMSKPVAKPDQADNNKNKQNAGSNKVNGNDEKDGAMKITDYSKPTRAYIDGFKNKKSISDLKLTGEEDSEFGDELRDPISMEVMNIPVRLNGTVYDLQTLVDIKPVVGDMREDPLTRDEFFLRDIQPARDVAEKIQIKLTQIERNRNVVPMQVSSSNNIDTLPPGGPKF